GQNRRRYDDTERRAWWTNPDPEQSAVAKKPDKGGSQTSIPAHYIALGCQVRQNRSLARESEMARNVALLFTDIVDSTSTTQRLGDEGAAAIWTEHNRRARDLLRQYNGREIGRSDGLLMQFEEAADAARYALQYHAQMAEMGLAARAGMHVGSVLFRESSDDDVALGAKQTEVEGLAIPFASRVMAMARGGQTLLTAGAKEALDP